MKKTHINYYILEAAILGLGFFIVYLLPPANQFIGITGVVLLYLVMGLLHHHTQHDMHKRIVLEYIIISVLVISLFIFFKSGRI